MSDQVYLMKHVPARLCKRSLTASKILSFNLTFNPTAEDVEPFSTESSEDIKLAEQLQLLLENNKVGIVGQISVNGYAGWCEQTDDPIWPQWGQNVKDTNTCLEISVGKELSLLLDELYPRDIQSTSPRYRVQIEGIFDNRKSQELGKNLISTDITNSNNYSGARRQYFSRITFSTSIWNKLFEEIPEDGGIFIKITMLFYGSPNSSKQMNQKLPFVFPSGKGYCLTPVLRDFVQKRKLDMKAEKNEKVVIVSDSGKIWKVYQDYIMEGSLVFRNMLETKGFKEEQTKQIKLPVVSDKTIDELINFLSYYDMNACFKDMDLAIDLLEVAERYQVNELKSGIETMLLARACEEFEIGQALKLFEITGNLKHLNSLTSKSVKILHDRLEDLKTSKTCTQFFSNKPHLAKELFIYTMMKYG